MVTFNDAERSALCTFFDRLDEADIPYVVARKYERLPSAAADGDVDVFVSPDEFDAALAWAEACGFESNGSTVSNAAQLAKQAAGRPASAARQVIANPQGVINLARNKPSPHKQGYRNAKRVRGDVLLDLRNHLAYTSPSNGRKIRIDPDVERRFFDRRRRHDEGFYVPSTPDELAHLLPHCIYDKGGEFSDYYAGRCEELLHRVRSDEADERAFHELLSDLFYGADELVYELAAIGEYDEIRSRLRRFDEY